jgi:hypothetical protein
MISRKRLEPAELQKLLTPDQLEKQLAQDALQDSINEKYPAGQFVAVHDGRIVADSSRFDELIALLTARNVDPNASMIMRAGDRVTNYVYFHSLQ